MLSLERAIEAFIRAWARSRAGGDSDLTRFDGVWHLRFERRMASRSGEIFAVGHPPEKVVDLARKCQGNQPHWLTVFHDPAEEVAGAYESLGYRGTHREHLMARELGDGAHPLPELPDQGRVRRLSSRQDVTWYNSTHVDAPLTYQRLGDPLLGFYALDVNDVPVVRARMVLVARHIAVLDAVRTLPEYRRRGHATALLTGMLAEAVEAGADESTLASSQEGFHLYQRLGYRELAGITVLVSL